LITERLRRRVALDFPSPATTEAVEADSTRADSGQAVERIQAAVVLSAHGNWNNLVDAHRLALLDWRDLLANAGLEHDNWPSRLDVELGL
jgi:hypothetical protein